MRAIHHLHGLLWPALLVMLLSGCATTRGVVEIKAPSVINTDTGTYAKIVAVDDLRKFEVAPKEPHIPSLMNASDITDPAITARAVARKRGGYGNAAGDILMPPGQSVAGLIRAAAAKALADKGYTVVETDSPRYATAAPLNVDIVKFWSWFSPGFATVRIDFEGELTLHGPSFLDQDPTTVTGHETYEGMAIFGKDWVDLVERGAANLSLRIEEKIKPASGH